MGGVEKDLSHMEWFPQLTPQNIQTWAEGLSLFNTNSSSYALARVIEKVRISPLALGDYFEILECLSGSVELLVKRKYQEILQRNVGLAKKNEEGSSFINLQLLMASAYLDLLNKGNLAQSQQLSIYALSTLVLREMYHLMELQKFSACIYTTLPPEFWNNLHQIYLFAEKHQLTHHTISLTTLDGFSRVTFIELYKKMLLFATIHSFRFHPKEIETIDFLLSNWIHLVEFHRPARRIDLYAVDLEKDEGPCYQVLVQYEPNTTWCTMDTTNLAAATRRMIKQMDERGEYQESMEGHWVSENLLQRLHEIWSVKPVRRYPRLEKKVSIAIQPGWPSENGKIQIWQEVNTSAEGYCILKNEEDIKQNVPGDLVLLSESPHPQKNWHLGVVRWVQFKTPQQIWAGIQLLTPKVDICEISTEKTGVLSIYLLPAIEALKIPSTVVIPNLNWKRQDTVLLKKNNVEQAIKLTRCMESNENFCQFEFEVL